MIIRKITLRHFRNVPLATLAFEGRRQFLVGSNGQGKTNLIEAAGCLTALRSFRTSEIKNLIMQGQPEAAMACEVEREETGHEKITIRIRSDGKGIWRNDKRVARLADHLGLFPTVVFSSEDLQLIRGSPTLRRRWLDLALSAVDPGYLAALQVYSRALASRNSLLRQRDPGTTGEIAAFERALAPAGATLVALRTAGIAELAGEMALAYRRMSEGSEVARLAYAPATGVGSAEEFLAQLEKGRARDLQAGTSLVGPHRDDLRFDVGGADAGDFASEGQQRSAVLALRLAQAAWSHRRCGVRPVLLADDVLGELDAGRRDRFWGALDPESQVIATGTRGPDAGLGEWQVFSVSGGVFSPDITPRPPAGG